jgi:two-component system LytT family response regulator
MLRRPPVPAAMELAGIARSIDWIEAADNYVEVHLGERVVLLRMTMSATERELSALGFLRIHRRFLVNRARVQAVLGTNGDRRVRVAGKDLPVGSRYATGLRL